MARGGCLHPGQPAPLKSSISHHLMVLHKDIIVREVHLFMAIPLVTDHLPQGIFVTILLTGGQAPHQATRDLSRAQKGSQDFPIRNNGVETLGGITVQERGPLRSTRVTA